MHTNSLFHGSFAGEPEAAASFLGSKPVIFGGAIASLAGLAGRGGL